MIKTPTLSSPCTYETRPDRPALPEGRRSEPCTGEPSESIIRNILNFSRSLEVKVSELVGHIEIVST
jgi:hypothetical protein